MSNWSEFSAWQVPQGMVDALRAFSQDLRARNRLIGGLEHLNDSELELALKFSLDDWNTTTPPTRETFESHPSVVLLFLGAQIRAQDMRANEQTNNQLTFSNSGISQSVSDKTALHVGHAQRMQAEYETKKRLSKTAANLEQAYSGTWSEYGVLGHARGVRELSE